MKFTTTAWHETRVRRTGKKAGVRRQVGEEHFFALSFLVLFSTKCFIPLWRGKKGRRKRSRTELRLAKSFCLIKRPVHDLLLFFFVLIQKRTKKDQARTLPLYALLAALQPHMPEWAALFVHVRPAIPK